MTVINLNSISGISSITAHSSDLSFYAAGGSALTFSNLNATSINGGPLAGARNRIINGDMRIAQRGTAAVTSAGYPVDRWVLGYTTSGAVSAQYETASVPVGFQSAIKLTTTTADATTNATDQWNIQQWIEGFNTADLLFGTANAKTVTLSFWVRSSITGTFCATLLNYDGAAVNRSYVSEYTINVADTWEYKTITVPGDTSGTWLKDSDRGMSVRFGLTAGTNFQQAADSWSTGNFVGSSNQTQLLETLNATWYVTGVQLEAGTVATPFERRSYGQELALCRRYYKKGLAVSGGSAQVLYGSQYGTSNAANMIDIDMPSFRAAPNVSLLNNSNVQYYSYGGAWTASTFVATTTGTWPSSLLYLYGSADGDGRGKLLRCTNATSVEWVANAEL